MGKIYKGYELIKEIEEGNIENNTKIEILGRFSGDLEGSYFIYKDSASRFPIYKPDNEEYFDEVKMSDILNFRFRVIEDEEIDIQSIEELDTHTFDSNIRTITIQNRNKINELVQAVKQLDKRTKKK